MDNLGFSFWKIGVWSIAYERGKDYGGDEWTFTDTRDYTHYYLTFHSLSLLPVSVFNIWETKKDTYECGGWEIGNIVFGYYRSKLNDVSN
jgi:hypothetical protein